jgi:hypothetical protein
LSGANEPDPGSDPVVIDPVSVALSARGRQEALAFVEAKGLSADARGRGEVSNAHVTITPLDLVPGCNVYGRWMEITLQYFDGCPNWQTTEERLAVITAERSDITVSRQLIETQAEAETVDFRGSPTLLADGVPLFPVPEAPPGLSCRVYLTPAGLAGSPTTEQIRDAIVNVEAGTR